MELLLVNLVLDGVSRPATCGARRVLRAWCPRRSGVPIPENYPVLGRDAFRTATGVHAAAVIKAFGKKVIPR